MTSSVRSICLADSAQSSCGVVRSFAALATTYVWLSSVPVVKTTGRPMARR
ncbi:hypothetical protein SNARM312S_03673 [Streptomyces narbonensis]